MDEGRDKDEWQKFLTLLSKYRRKEPLNGLVVTVSADKLLELSVCEESALVRTSLVSLQQLQDSRALRAAVAALQFGETQLAAIRYMRACGSPELVDHIATVTTDRAMAMARRLAAEASIFAGTSTGANVLTAIDVASRLGAGSTVVTVACDSGIKYLSTRLYAS